MTAYAYLGDARTTGIINVGANAAGSLLAPGGNIGQQLVMTAPSIAGGILTAGGSTSIAATAWGTMAIPIIGAAVAGVTIGLMLLYARKGPKQKVATTKIVDQVEPQLQDNLRGYLEGPRTVESYEQALANFAAGWGWVVEHCGAAVMDEPGQRCINERKEGGSAPWCPTTTGCDWFTLYRDPILANPPVARASATGGGNLLQDATGLDFSSIFGPGDGGSGSLLPLLLGGGLIAAAVLL